MKIFKDKFTGDELFADTYKIELVDDIVYRVKGKMVTEKIEIDDSKLGANASAEGAEDDGGCDPSSVSGVDVVLRSRLNEFALDKKGYMSHIKEYMKMVKEKLADESPEQLEVFQANAQKFVKTIISSFKDYQLFCGESMKPEGMLCLLKWEEVDGEESPYVYFFKHGLDEEKV